MSFLDLIKEEKLKRKTILLFSHIFEEIEKICDWVGIIKDGYLIALEDIKSLKPKTEDVFEVHLSEQDDNILKSEINVVHIKENIYHVVVKNNYDLFF